MFFGGSDKRLALKVAFALVAKATGVASLADRALEDELADGEAGCHLERHRAEVAELQTLLVGDARLHETGRDMDQQAEPSESAPPFQPPTQMWREGDLLQRDPQDRLSRHKREAPRHVDLLCDGLIVRVFGHSDDFPGLAEDPEF